MNNNRFTTGVMVVVFAACGMSISIVSHANVGVASPLAVPTTGRSYTIQQLVNLISHNGANPNAGFMVVTTDSYGKTAMVGFNQAAIKGSASSTALHMKDKLTADAARSVTLQSDPAFLNYLASRGALPAKGLQRDQYARIALYFNYTFNGKSYRMFIAEPCLPGLVSGKSQAGIAGQPGFRPLQAILEKWDFKTSYNPAS